MKRLLFGLMLIVFAVRANAQQNYAVSAIDKKLMPYASAVVRKHNVRLEVQDISAQTLTVSKAITILNSSGEDEAEMVIYYDKLSAIKYIKGAVYDESGKSIAKISERDFMDSYAGQDFSLFEDTRVKHYKPAITTYPYTIEYEYQQKVKQTLALRSWHPADSYGVAVEQSSFTFASTPDFKVRFKQYNLPTAAAEGQEKNLKTYTWKVDNLNALRFEPYSPQPELYLPTVKMAPVQFSYGAYKGNFSNWNELGKWTYDQLLNGRDALPPETVDRVKALVKDISDPKQKAKVIYEFMQQRTRYISVQVGIGGYQPFTATSVDKLSYGDCKALVNYTQALFKAVGIESWYCVVEAGEEKISFDKDFASMNQGNHVILCLPFKNDTTWLECTNQKIPFGYLGDFTDDRVVLACTQQGGILLHTPKYTVEQNTQTRKVVATIDKDGLLSANVNTVYSGIQYDNRTALYEDSQEERLKKLPQYYPVNNIYVKKLTLSAVKDINPRIDEQLDFTAPDYASFQNKEMYFLPNLTNRRRGYLKDIKNRKTDIYIERGFVDDDEITYLLPADYSYQKLPLNLHIEKPFGKLDILMTLTGNKLVYHRRVQMNDGKYPKDMYPEMVEFFSKLVDADVYSATLTKKQ